MALAKYDSSFAYDQVLKRGIAGQVAKVVDAETGIPVEGLQDLEGRPIPALVSNSQGYLPPFQIEGGPSVVQMQVGSVSYILVDYLLVGDSASAAQDAAAAAQQAANLVEAPADEVVATLVQGDTLTQTAGDARWVTNEGADAVVGSAVATPGSESAQAVKAIADQSVAPVSAIANNTASTVQNAADPLSFLDNVKILARIPNVASGEAWPQGISINATDNEIYISRQLTTSLVIDVRDLSTAELKSSKSFTTEDGAFSEGIPWFKNGSGDLCFIVQATVADNTYNILNYTTSTMGPVLAKLGKSRVDVVGNQFVSSDAQATWINNLYLYDWASVKAGTPATPITIPVNNAGPTAAKSQGLAIVGGYIYLVGGNQSESPTVTVYNMQGQLQTARQYSRGALRKVLESLTGEAIPTDYFYESEGATNLDGKLVTSHIVNWSGSGTTGWIFVLQHNNVGSPRMQAGVPATFAYDTGWRDIPLESGWGQNPTAQARRVGNQVFLRGELFNATQPGDGNAYVKAGQMPSDMRPTVSMRFPSSYTSIPQAVRVDPGGGLMIMTASSTGGPRPLNHIRYFIN